MDGIDGMDGMDGRTGGREGGRRARSDDPAIHRPVVISVRVQPRAARTEVTGMHGSAVKIRLKAPPVDGAANEELLRYVARRLGLPRANVELVGGATARTKHLRISGGARAGDEIMRLLCTPEAP